MARVDYETAWRTLQGELAEEGHPQRGQKWLLQRMARLAAENAVPESLIERAGRIFGLPRLVQATLPEHEAADAPDSLRAVTPSEPGPPMTQGGHDGEQHEAESYAPNGAAAA